MPECRGPSVDRQAVPLRVSVAIGDAPLDYPIARNGSEPRNDFCVLAKGLLNAKQNRAVELPPLWLGCVRVEDKQFHAAADTGRETAYVDGTKFPAGI